MRAALPATSICDGELGHTPRLREMGVQIRDVQDEFEGADFRDEETKLMFAYDYKNRHVLRSGVTISNRALYYEMKRLGVGIYNRTL